MASFVKLVGGGVGGAYQAADPFGYQSAEKLRNDLNLLMQGQQARGVYAGGDWDNGVDAHAAGDLDVLRAVPIGIDNTGSGISGSVGLVCRMTYYCRVSNAAITVTPKIMYGTDGITFGSTAAIAGQAACSAISGLYTGANQLQQVTFTLPAGVNFFKPRFTVGGVPAAGYQAWLFVTRDLYVA